MAYATLMTPVDVSLSNGAVVSITDADGDSVAPVWSFTFQGDYLSWGQIECYDVDTDEVTWFAYFPKDADWRAQENLRFNGDSIRIRDTVMQTNGISGRNYKWLLRQYQNDPTTNAPKCDIRFGSGIVQEVSSGGTGTTIRIDTGITKLRNPYYFEDMLIGCTYIEINHERRMIVDYNKTTGVATLADGFSAGVVNVGDLYRLYTNYIESGYYDFKIRDIPVLTETSSVDANGALNLQGTYAHPNNVNMEAYRYKIYAYGGASSYTSGQLASTFTDEVDNQHLPIGGGLSSDIVGKRLILAVSPSVTTTPVTVGYTGTIVDYNISTGIATLLQPIAGTIEPSLYYSIVMGTETLIEESNLAYNYHLDFKTYAYFWDKQLSIVLETISKEKQYATKTIMANYASGAGSLSTTITLEQLDVSHSVLVSAPNLTGTVNVYRKDENNQMWLHIGQLPSSGQFIDRTAGNNHTYTYRLHKYNAQPKDSDEIETNFMGWTVTALTPKDTPYQNNRTMYKAGETWHFIAGNQPSDISHNLGIVEHDGTSEFPTTSRSNNKFERGTFTANLLTIECPSNEILDDIERVERWQRFINGDNPFLLKSDKGDVWIINIVGTPTRQYDESTSKVLTTVSYEWVQVDDTRKAYII